MIQLHKAASLPLKKLIPIRVEISRENDKENNQWASVIKSIALNPPLINSI